jgi:glutamate-1-semialdehyde 2,1-aminomutase
MLRRGHLLPPSQSDAAVVSLAHTEADIDATVAAAHQVLQQVVAPRRANQTAAPS